MEERLQEILRIAMKYGVTDIHFSSQDDSDRINIEMRIKGNMKRLKAKDADVKLLYYLMYKANLDISNVLAPQTGRFEECIGNERLSLRFSVVSSYHMKSGVLRILNNHSDLGIEQLSDDPETREWLSQITVHRNGLYIFSGPTGSGKTTSLYTILNACREKKIYTLEDPIEVVNRNYVQLQINDRMGFSYAEGIKQLMRQDPDIIMIGEIRDTVVATMAVRCALTGHLVVTSLHSFSCISALHRMEELGVERYHLQDVLTGISCQRLYDTEDGRKTGIYEFMGHKEVMNYFERGQAGDSFIPLSEKIKTAVDKGIISYQKAEADLIG